MESLVEDILLMHSDSDRAYLLNRQGSLSYRATIDIARQNAGNLSSWGLGNVNCLLVADNSVEFCIAFWSLVFAGCVPVLVNPSMSAQEMLRVLRSADGNVVLTTERRKEHGEALHQTTGVADVRIGADLSMSIYAYPREVIGVRASAEVAVMLMSSGTTGLPKLVQLTHRNLHFVSAGHNARMGLASSDRVLVVLRLFHASAFVSQFLAQTLAGGVLVVYDEPIFTPRSFCRWINDMEITCTAVVPTIVRMLTDYRHVVTHTPRQLRYLCCAGDVLQRDLAVEMQRVWPGVSLVCTYGLTETATRVAYLFPDQAERSPAAIGTPLPQVLVRVIGISGCLAEAGEIGEIQVRGPNVMPGYYGAFDTKAVFIDDWLRTGDFGKLNSIGMVDFVGRIKNTIITRGMNVSPEEVERELLEHASIRDVRVFGMPDEMDGQRVCAEVVVSSERAPMDLTDLHAFLHGRLAMYKFPRRLDIVSEISRTATGKTDRVRDYDR
jgi:acyl-CoA synthetase (AMP-forming)/AMP-acid ligase II